MTTDPDVSPEQRAWGTFGAAIGGAAVAGAVAVAVGARRAASGPRRSPAAPRPGEGASSARARTAPDPDAPSKPEGPEDLSGATWKFSLKKVLREFGADHCTDLAASLVYYSVLALFPALIAIVSLIGLVADVKTIENVVFGLIGSGGGITSLVKPVIESTAKSPAAGLGFVIGLLGAIWSASGFVGAFGRAMNRVYDIDEGRPVWKLRPTQLGVTVVVLLLVTVGALLLALSGDVARTIGGAVGLSDAFVFVFGIVKWPILVVIAVAAIAILYYFAPNVKQPKFKWTSTGSIVALVILAIGSFAFVLYVGNGSKYNATYGTLGGVIAFLLWLWIANLALLFGAEFDAEAERGRELQAGLPAEEAIQLPPRDTRQSDKRAKKHEQDVAQARRIRQTRGQDA